MTVKTFSRVAAVLLAGSLATATTATMAQEAAPAQGSFDLIATHSKLSAGLPTGDAVDLRGTWLLPGGDVIQAELLDERKFGDRGGVAGLAYTKVWSPEMFFTGTFVYGHGGPNWADWRGDVQVSRKWLADGQLVTSLAVYRALFDAARNDSGYRVSAAWYLPGPAVLEAGVTLNESQPGGIHSHMPFASATFGREGVQYLSVRVSRGTEAYQALGTQAQLVNFRSRSQSVNWRRWLGPRWGVSAQAEYYENPTYHRTTLGAGLFVQW